VRYEVKKSIVGQEVLIERLLVALLARGHILVEGVPGLAKTLAVKSLAEAIGGQFNRVQFTPDLVPADLVGTRIYHQPSGEFQVSLGPVFTNLLLADEINRAPAKTQAALLEVMQEGQVTIEGTPHPLEPPFMVLATQNPIEQEGTYALPEAQLDRFILKVRIDYPPGSEEAEMVKRVTAGQVGDKLNVEPVTTIIKPGAVVALQTITAAVVLDDKVLDYAVRIARATRTWNGVAAGAGPRGGIALARVARAAALIAGRDFVTPDDVKRMALPALRHRVTPAPELEIEGHSSDTILKALLEKVEAPRT
jgi:MoxR-like ATPase